MTDLDLLVIGNGFDLACGLKTSYNDFHSALKASIESKTDEFYKYPGMEYTKSFYKNDNIIKFIVECQNLKESNNFFVNYFYNCKEHIEWNRVETEIEKIVILFDFILDSLDKYVYSNKECQRFDASNISNCLSVLSNFNEYLGIKIRVDSFHLKDGSVKHYITLIGFNDNETKDKFIRVQELKEELPQKLFDDLLDFSNLFSLYLESLIDNPTIKKPNFKFKKVISYNYTSTIKYYIGNEDIDICYIHGNIKDKNIIFGPKPLSFKIPAFNIFSKSAQCLYRNTDYMELVNDYISKTDKNNIGFFGHTFDLADSSTLKLILGNKEKNNMIYIYYYDDKSKRNIISNLMQILGAEDFEDRVRNNRLCFLKCENVFK